MQVFVTSLNITVFLLPNTSLLQTQAVHCNHSMDQGLWCKVKITHFYKNVINL